MIRKALIRTYTTLTGVNLTRTIETRASDVGAGGKSENGSGAINVGTLAMPGSVATHSAHPGKRRARLPVELVRSASLGITRATERPLYSAIAVPLRL